MDRVKRKFDVGCYAGVAVLSGDQIIINVYPGDITLSLKMIFPPKKSKAVLLDLLASSAVITTAQGMLKLIGK